MDKGYESEEGAKMTGRMLTCAAEWTGYQSLRFPSVNGTAVLWVANVT